MALALDVVQNILQCSVNGQGTANGWTFSLPAGVLDNDQFQISGDYVQPKSTGTFRCAHMVVRIMAVNGGTTVYANRLINVVDFGMKMTALGQGISYNSTIYSSFAINNSGQNSYTISFNFYINATPSINHEFAIFGKSSAATYYMYIYVTTTSGVILYCKTGAGASNTMVLTSTNTCRRGQWNQYSISIPAGSSVLWSTTLNGVVTTSGSNVAFPNLNFSTGLDSYGGPSGSGNTMIISDLKVIENSTTKIDEKLQSLPTNASALGSPTFNQSS